MKTGGGNCRLGMIQSELVSLIIPKQFVTGITESLSFLFSKHGGSVGTIWYCSSGLQELICLFGCARVESPHVNQS